MTANHYTFGDNSVAEQRLVYLADAFEPSSRAWLKSLELKGYRIAIDLGCGIGRTTDLLAEVALPKRVFGLDRSERLLNRARAESCSGAVFLEHDVTSSPFPIPTADLLYARFLLTHLAEPVKVLKTWSEVLCGGGLLVLEDTARLYSEHPVYRRYYELVAAMQAHYGQNQEIGRDFERLVDQSIWSVERSVLQPVKLLGRIMARLHAMNICTWKNDAYIKDNVEPAELTKMGSIFERYAADDDAPPVTCEMRHAVLKRRLQAF